MMFNDFEYARPDMSSLEKEFEQQLHAFEHAATFEAQDLAFQHINEMRTTFTSMYNICHIRHTIDTRDHFYEKENTFFDQHMPAFEALKNQFYQKLMNARFRKELEAKWGQHLFILAELHQKTFLPTILEDMQAENQLSSSYTKIKAQAKIELDGKEYNLSTIQKEESSKDRQRRKAAAEAKWSFYQGQSATIEDIYHQLVQTRHSMAQKLGYTNYVELGYARMMRSDYTAQDVAAFRAQVLEHIVPVASELYERHRKRLGVETLRYYDEDFRFASGNPTPKGAPEWIVTQAQQMYKELAPETHDFFQQMLSKQLMDLEAREGKATGGYCTFIGAYKAPYIFSNFNGTSSDIDVLTHEAGHAFQVYSSRNVGLTEYQWPTFEACEIHSMSMEFFTWPWMHLFFGEDTDKYKFAHLAGAVKFLPYGVAIDEFQHTVYEHPDMT
ncbi:MAG: M3 family oligoendopeptidase, partial [Bacteroidota bacterium]